MRRLLRKLLIALTPVIVIAGFTSSLHGQITNVADDTATPVPGAGHAYIHAFSETVNPANGSVSLQLSVPVPQSRGLTIPFSFNYNSSGVYTFASFSLGHATYTAIGSTGYFTSGGWGYSFPRVAHSEASVPNIVDREFPCPVGLNYVFSSPTGGIHSLNVAEFFIPNPTCAGSNTLSGGDAEIRADATYNNGPGALFVHDADGTLYDFSMSGGCGPSAQKVQLPGQIEDRNGNVVTFSQDLACSGAVTLKDTAGRPAISSSGFGTTGNTVTVSGLANPYTVTWETISASYDPAYTFLVSPPPGVGCVVGVTSSSSIKVIQAIELPNGQSYNFTYDSTGLLKQVTYPDGGFVRYDWGTYPASEYGQFVGAQNVPPVPGPLCQIQYGIPAISHRYVSYDGVTIAEQQDFVYGTPTWSDLQYWSSRTTTVTTHDLLAGKTFDTVYTYAPVYSPVQPQFIFPNYSFAGQIPVESVIVHKNTSGTAIQTENEGWLDQYRQQNIQTTWNVGGATSKVMNYYSPSYTTPSELTEKDEFDYGNTSSTPTRKTNIFYQTFPSSPIGATTTTIYDRPCQVITSDSSGTSAAETDYLYDGATGAACGSAVIPSVSGVSGPPLPTGTHDEPNYSTSGTIARGNATTVTKKCFPSCSDASTTYTYDETGQPLSMTDPKLNVTQYSFTDSPSGGNSYGNSNAYLTSVTMPTTANGIAHTESFQYYYGPGELYKATDQNLQTTTYTYDDPMARLKQTSYPDGGQTSISYNDNPYSSTSPSVTTSTLINATTTITKVVLMDGMGHSIHTQLTSDTGGTDYTDTTYDGRGNVASVSNPYRLGDTVHNTLYSYDVLNRKLEQTNPDSTTESWQYNGNIVTFTNELTKSWISTSDSFGRLTDVVEPTGGTTAIYTYDALNDLKSVSQGAESRSFNFDSLSRLTSATNPESGTTTYSYDLNSNVQTRTDARSITTTYGYDQLNRLLSKTYSDGTYPVTYTYDTSSTPGAAYIIGRLTDEKTSVQTATMTELAIDQYDPMGRVKSERQCFVGGCGGATNYTLTHSYDLAGNVTGSDNGLSGTNAASFSFSYDTANRLVSVTSSLNDNTHPQVLFQALNFNAIGLTQAGYAEPSLGGTPGFTQTLTYDTRTRLNSESDVTPSSTTLYGYNIVYDGAGNLTSLTNDPVMGSWTYAPDALNRLHTATATAGTYSGLTLTQAYDNAGYGNREGQTVNGGYSGPPITQPALVSFSGNNNRVDQWTYDLAGNVTNDTNKSYEYDAEERQTGTLDTTTGLTGYVYDAEGRRVMKVLVEGWNTPNPTTVVQKEYLLGLGAEQVSVLDGSGNWQWTNAYAGSKQLASYDIAGTHFALTDWLGTKRVQVGVTAPSTVSIGEQCDSMPFGDNLNCTGSDVNGLHFTGRERDTESANDYLEARYYASNIAGRFLTPDWSAKVEPVPYVKLDNPQSLNLYTYVWNNPLNSADADGHATDNAQGPGPVSCANTASGSYCKDPIIRKAQQQGKPTNQPVDPAPTGADGKPAPPKVPVPGCPSCGWVWHDDPKNPRGGSWGPDSNYPTTPGGLPGASWDTGSKGGPGHWDVWDGSGGPRDRYDADGKPMPGDVAHPPGWRPIWNSVGGWVSDHKGLVIGGVVIVGGAAITLSGGTATPLVIGAATAF